MLKQRITTAAVLILVLSGVMYLSEVLGYGGILHGYILLLAVAAMWEWARLNQSAASTQRMQIFAPLGWAALLGGLGLVLSQWGVLVSPLEHRVSFWRTFWLTVGLLWVVFAAWVLWVGPNTWRKIFPSIRQPLGVTLVMLTWLAVCQLERIGLMSLFASFLVVWIADIAGYFGGRKWGQKWFGGRKLAPTISPGKTWEGLVCGVLGVLMLWAVWPCLLAMGVQLGVWQNTQWPSVFAITAWPMPLQIVFLILLTVMSASGDLFESLIKRAANVKDSSNLLPGHGGVLDRMDALFPTLPMSLMALLV